MDNLLDLKFWFDPRAGSLAPAVQTALIIFILILAIISLMSYILTKTNKSSLYYKSWKRLNSFSITNFIFGAALLFFTYEMTPFLSSRFWFMVWMAEMIVWMIFIIKNVLDIPRRKEQIEKEREFKKYIP